MVQLLLFTLSPVITRLYTPEDFGLYTIYFSLLGLFAMIIALRYDIAIPIPQKNLRALYLMSIALISTFFLSTLIFLVCSLGGHYIVDVFQQPEMVNYLLILPLGLMMVGLCNIFTYYSVRGCQFSLIAQAKMFQGLGMIATQLTLGMLITKPIGLILGTLVGHISAVLLYLRWYLRNQKKSFQFINWKYMPKIARRYYKFPLFSTPAILINSLGIYMPAIIFSMIYGSETAGWYGLVLQVVVGPLGLIGQAIGQVYTGQGANLKNQGQMIQLRDLYLRVMLTCFWLALPLALILFLFGAPLFSFVFGQGWHTAGSFAQLLSFMFLIEFVAVGPSQNLALLERQDLNLYWNIFFTGLIACAFYPALYCQADITTTLIYLCIAKSIGYLTMIALNLYVLSSSRTMEMQCVE